MTGGTFRFERFSLELGDRQLRRDGSPIELNSRYFDALALLVREQGRLVSKDRFMDEVWRGVPVTDEALTQCIKTLRRQLGDSASSPRLIETVPKHGYRFIAPVESGPQATPAGSQPRLAWQRLVLLGGAGTVGGGLAGLVGGLFYGFAGASQPLQPGMGAVSILLVLLCLTILVAVMGAAGVALGIAAAEVSSRKIGPSAIVGGALGGLLVGAVVKLLGLDGFSLLFGQSPGDITGGFEGLLLGGGVGVGAWLADRLGRQGLRAGAVAAGIAGGTAGLLIPMLGGRLMGGSLDLLARHFPNSRLRLEHIGGLLGEADFGPVSQRVTGLAEGALFAACIVVAMMIARRSLDQ